MRARLVAATPSRASCARPCSSRTRHEHAGRCGERTQHEQPADDPHADTVASRLGWTDHAGRTRMPRITRVAPVTKAPAETFSRHFLGISLRRAFRLAHQDRRGAAQRARAPRGAGAATSAIPSTRRSSRGGARCCCSSRCMFVPLTISRFIETFDGPHVPHLGRVFMLLPAIAEAVFCIVMFDSSSNWAQWKKQRRDPVLGVGASTSSRRSSCTSIRSAPRTTTRSTCARRDAAIDGMPAQGRPPALHMIVGMAFGVQALLAARAEGDLADAGPDPRVDRHQAAVPGHDRAGLADDARGAALRAVRVHHRAAAVSDHRQLAVPRRQRGHPARADLHRDRGAQAHVPLSTRSRTTASTRAGSRTSASSWCRRCSWSTASTTSSTSCTSARCAW